MATKTTYPLSGMTCQGCVKRVKNALEQVDGIHEVEVQLTPQQATITSTKDITFEEVQGAISGAGNYDVSKPQQSTFDQNSKESIPSATPVPEANTTTYKPLILIISFITGVTLLAQYPFESFSPMLWMRHFMAGFFLVFSFFKLLNLQGFVTSYSMYDTIARKWKDWGYIYPFLELVLGILYLTNIAPVATNIGTIIILGVSSIGVIESVLNKKKIKCACLGDIFQLPMTTVTIIEDIGMVLMAGAMLVYYL